MLSKFFPFIKWFDGYSFEDLKSDLISGITVALVLIPQSMAYAQLAGLPPHYGLYASFLPPIVAAFFGSSRQLATGPVAVVSLMSAAALEPLAVTGSEGFIQYAILLALLVGVVQLALGLLHLGVVVNLLSHPVLLGFTNAAAIVIATSQLGKFLGVSVEKEKSHFHTVWKVIEQAMDYIYWPTLAFGIGAFILMFFLKRLNPKIPYVLIAVALSTSISYFFNYGHDEVISLREVDGKELYSLIREFNKQLATIEASNKTRTILESVTRRIKKQQGKPCTRCHPSRGLNPEKLTALEDKDGDGEICFSNLKPREILTLHLMAGVIDEFIDDAKKNLMRLKKVIRSFKFIKKQDENGRFYFELLLPNSHEVGVDGKVWHIKVGNSPLDPNMIALSGGGSILGEIPRGLPSFSKPKFDMDVANRLILPAFIIALVGFMEAISIAKFMAAKSGQRLDPNQELIGQGLANIIGSFFQSFAVSGSFSRSAVNFQTGAKSGLSSLFSSVVVLIVMLFLTPLLYYLPQSVLAAVIMMAVLGLINIKGIQHIFKVSFSDGFICIITFILTLVFAPHLDKGIIIGVLLSLGVFFYKLMRPSIAVLSLWKDGHFRNARKFNLDMCKHLAIIRFDGPFFFANIGYLEDEVLRIVRQMPELKAIIFKCNGINIIDSSGEEALSLLVDRLRSAGYTIYFSGLKEQIIEVLQNSSLYSKIGPENIFPTVFMAVEKIWPLIHEKVEEELCPLRFVVQKKVTDKEREIVEQLEDWKVV